MIKPISEEALIWAKIKKVLKTKGADAAIAKLKQIRFEQQLRNAPVFNHKSLKDYYPSLTGRS